jgi:hypothetical protein
MNLGSPSILEVKMNAEKTEFRFLLYFSEEPKRIEFEIPAESAMLLMHGLQRLQALHKISIPSSVRPRGKPKLRVVIPDE